MAPSTPTTAVDLVRTTTPAMVEERSPIEVMSDLISQGVDLDKIEKAMELQDKWEVRRANQAFLSSMAEFKRDPPEIIKSVIVDYPSSKGRVQYAHADIGEASSVINKALAPHGLSISWKPTQETAGTVCVTCTVTHLFGHSEAIKLCGPLDTSGGKDALKSLGSTISYLSRYTLLLLLGIAAKGQCSEAPAPQFITDKQVADLNDLVRERVKDHRDFLTFLKIPSLAVIPAHSYDEVRALLLPMAVL